MKKKYRITNLLRDIAYYNYRVAEAKFNIIEIIVKNIQYKYEDLE